MALWRWQKLGKAELPMSSLEWNLSILDSAKARKTWCWRENQLLVKCTMLTSHWPKSVGHLFCSVRFFRLFWHKAGDRSLLFPWPLELTHYFGVRWTPAAVFGDLKPEMIVGSKKGWDCMGGTEATELWEPGCYRLCPGTVNTGRHTENTSVFLASMWCWHWLRIVNGANC